MLALSRSWVRLLVAVALDTARLSRPIAAGDPPSVTVTIDDTDDTDAPSSAPANFRVTAKVRYLLLRWDKLADLLIGGVKAMFDTRSNSSSVRHLRGAAMPAPRDFRPLENVGGPVC